MFGKFTYLFYTLIFTLPLILALMAIEPKLLKKQFKPIMLVTLFLTIVYGIVLWQIALTQRLWTYGSDKILGITLFGTVLEDIIWWFLITFLISFFTVIVVERVDREGSKVSKKTSRTLI